MLKSTDRRGPLLRVARVLRPNLMVRALSGAAVLWTFLPDDRTPASAIHRAFRRYCWSEEGFSGRVVLALGFLLWAPVTLVLATMCTWRCGGRVRRETGKGPMRQLVEQLAVAFRFAVSPPWYYIFEFYRDGHRRRAFEYLYRFETKLGIYNMLRRRVSSKTTTEALSNKVAFAERCERHGIAVIATLATATAGNILCRDGGQRLPREDLFFKPVRGAGGRGASRWFYANDGSYIANDGAVVTESDLAQHLRDLSKSENYFVRPCVRNRRELADLSPGALSTIRVVTCLDEHGCPEVTHAVMRMARGRDVVVDNFHAGGIAAPVDIRSGELGPATDMGLRRDSRWWDTHPISGAPIVGRKVPLWDDVLEIACRAHNAFADQVAIGWDVAVLEDGVFLVEGNKGPDLDIIQRVGREPVGNSRLGELLAFHLDYALSSGHGPAAATDAHAVSP